MLPCENVEWRIKMSGSRCLSSAASGHVGSRRRLDLAPVLEQARVRLLEVDERALRPDVVVFETLALPGASGAGVHVAPAIR